jgi:hypothetical protein
MVLTDVHYVSGTMYLAMEFVKNGDLRSTYLFFCQMVQTRCCIKGELKQHSLLYWRNNFSIGIQVVLYTRYAILTSERMLFDIIVCWWWKQLIYILWLKRLSSNILKTLWYNHTHYLSIEYAYIINFLKL